MPPCQQKLQSLKSIIGAKIWKMQNLFFFEVNKPNLVLEMRSPQPPEANGGSGADPPTLRRFFTSFSKKIHILSILWSTFLLKMRFQMIAKSVLVRPQGLRPH